MNIPSAGAKTHSVSVPWWSWPAIAASTLDSSMATNIATDAVLIRKIRFGSLIPFGIALTAAVFGYLAPGITAVFTESMIFMALALAIGLLLPSLGVLFICVYVISDLLRFLPMFTVGGFVGHFVAYWLLWLLVVDVPGVVGDFLGGGTKNGSKKPPVKLLVGAILTGVIVYTWTLGEPLLIRPFFTWAGNDPSLEAVYLVQVYGYILALIGALAAFFSGLFRTNQIVYIEVPTKPSTPLQILGRYVLPIAFVGGVISNAIDLVLLVIGAMLAHFIGGQFVGTELYEKSVGKIPRAYRFITAFVVTLIFSLVIMQVLYSVEAVSEFFPHVLVIAAGFFVFEFFTGEPRVKRMPQSIGLAIIIIAGVLLVPGAVVHADNCSGRSDCNGTAAGAAAAAAGAGAAVGLGRRGKGGKGGEKREKDAMDRAKEATDILSKMPGAPPLQKKVAKSGLDKLYDIARKIDEALNGKTD